MAAFHQKHRVAPGAKFRLADRATVEDGGLDKDHGFAAFESLRARLVRLQELLYAEDRHSLLVVLQALDTGGKDSAIRSVFSGVNPSGCTVAGFKQPSTLELRHDFLWRIHAAAPRRGQITIFNRSHYEDVLIVRVRSLVPEKRWKKRFDHINAFEKLLADEGTVILKFFLHISKDYQKERLQRRLDHPDKLWKFDPNDLAERARWNDYHDAYEDAISKCSTDWAPWYVVPAEARWYRDLVIASAIVETLEQLDMKYPAPTFDPATIHID